MVKLAETLNRSTSVVLVYNEIKAMTSKGMRDMNNQDTANYERATMLN